MRALLLLALLAAGPAAAQTQVVPAGPGGDAAPQATEAPAQPQAADGAAAPEPPWPPLPSIPAPQPQADGRLRDVVFHPNAVVTLPVAFGRQMTILFASGEKIASVAVGDSASWQVTASRSGDSLFVKPTGAYAGTNMTVITDTRVYLFDLVPGSGMDSVYLVRFVYQDAPTVAVDDAASRQAVGSYTVRGAKVLRPDFIRDDGSKTYIGWSAGKAMPAVFAIAPSGQEMLVDGYVRNGLYTIDRVYERLIFRFDRKVASATRK